MARFLVLEPPNGNAEEAVFVRDRFTFLAFVLPVAWFLYHRMWFEALAAFAVMGVLGMLGTIPALELGASLASLTISILVALEAPVLLAWALRRRGWQEAAALEAEDFGEAEIRYFALRETPAPSMDARRPAYRAVGTPALGLLDARALS